MATRPWPWRYDLFRLVIKGGMFVFFPVFTIYGAFDLAPAFTVVAVFVQVVLMAVATVFAFRWLRRRERAKWTPTSAFPPPDGELAVVEGRVHELTEHLEAPWSNRRCVAWCMAWPDDEVRIIQWRARAFVLEDLRGRGRIVVDASRRALVDTPDLAVAEYLGVLQTSEQRVRISDAIDQAEGEGGPSLRLPSANPGQADPPPYEWTAGAGDIVTLRGRFVRAAGEQDGEGRWPTFTIEWAGMERGSVEEMLARRGYHYYETWLVAVMAGVGVGLVTTIMIMGLSW